MVESWQRAQMYKAAVKGEWKTAEEMERLYPGALSMVISDTTMETPLHIATRAMKASFVEKLVQCLGEHELASKNRYGNTALCIAAAQGAVDIANILVHKCKALALIRGSGNSTPLLIAARYKRNHVVSYLLSKTPAHGFLTIHEQMELLLGAISSSLPTNEGSVKI
ncbi:ankyrin repeat-containing protein ITN1-like [Momordica charantia]|uniref:Ankyrin repeat-containing protein ITN1-like n=1 Tax=Momordica charantia TaxID=3673 RepID=A0A6J1E244_MOMCH|nr:ankyrin repeat-containing protein ITN1-like [Momordica charantia]